MIGIYFSGTGNSKYCAEQFLKEYKGNYEIFSIEEENVIGHLEASDEILLSFPVYFSSIPKILQDFIFRNSSLWKGKKVFIIATMAMFSGDGAGIAARLLNHLGAEIIGGLHLRMPDNISDECFFQRSNEKNRSIILHTKEIIKRKADSYLQGKPPQDGIGNSGYLAGFLGQRLLFGRRTKYYSDKLKIDDEKCIGCGICSRLCPMENIFMINNKAFSMDRCTLCYRCVNCCPSKAITLLGKKIYKQYSIEKYL